MKRKYAKLLIRQGVNLQSGQELIIDASIEHYEFVRMLVDEAYQAGAKDVIVNYHDEYVNKLRYMNKELDDFKTVPQYIIDLRNEYADRNAPFLSLTGDDPEGMMDVDGNKIQTYSVALHQACKPFYDGMYLGINRWCIAGVPTQLWANKVFPEESDEEAIESLWNVILKTVYCDKDDPIEYWNEHRHNFEDRVNKLNSLNIKQLHYTNSLGTDLYVGMNEDYLFAGGGSYTNDGIYSFPNMPTEEIFTSPNKDDVEGIVYNALPLYYNGHVIDNFYISFKKGRIIDYKAEKGHEILKSIIETDEGSHYLGEASLVPYDSPISNLHLLFYNTLYDENASCHLAIGKGFNECLRNGDKMSKEELFVHGINESMTHVDFMIGTKDLNIEATLNDGSKVFIFKDGNFDL